MNADHTASERSQTPAQWAVRWHGVVAAALLIGSVPLVHLGWHVGLGRNEPWIVTRSQTLAPVPVWSTVADGTWMLAGERHLREASPIVWWLRSAWNETLLCGGVSQSESVCVGRDGWLFLRAEVEADRQTFVLRDEVRRQNLINVRDRVRAAGAELLVMVVPDKSRIYPQFVFPGGAIAPGKAPHYPALLAELRDLGIATVDVAAGLQAAREQSPEQLLYYRGDTHWRPMGALAAAQIVAAGIEGGPLAAKLSPRHPLQLGGQTTVPGLGDLAASLGIGTVEVASANGEGRTVAMSFTAQRFTESLEFYTVAPVDRQDPIRLDGEDERAEILLVGTSYSKVNGLQALMLALGRSIRMVHDDGATSLVPMRRALAQLADPARPRPRLVIWEIVERGFCEDGWRAPAF